MKMWDGIGLSLLNLRKSPGKTLLTVLGLGVGIGAILTVVTLGSAGENQVETEIARLGVDKVWITAEETGALTVEDGLAVSQAADAPACAAAYTVSPVAARGEETVAQISGYDSGAPKVHGLTAQEGRLFLPEEYAQGSPVALIDEALADRLGGDMVGRYLDVGVRRFLVVGVLTSSAPQTLMQSSGVVVLPLNALLDTFPVQVSEITLSVPQGRMAEDVSRLALEALAGQGTFQALTLQEEIEAARSVVRIFVMVLACVAAVCMLTGVIGVMNILLVSVRERRREIGLLKAVGGTSAQVGVLFLLEAAGYSLLGCVLGAVLGMGMTAVFGAWIGLEAHVQVGTLLAVAAAALLTGLAFGVLPAMRAARMMPVEALRDGG